MDRLKLSWQVKSKQKLVAYDFYKIISVGKHPQTT